MKAAGRNTSKVDALLAAFRMAIELATDRYNSLRATARNKKAAPRRDQ